MAQGDKPDLSVMIKPRGGDKEDRIYLFSGWNNDGRISSLSIDRKIVEFAVKLEDGRVVRVKKDADGKWDHYVDCFLRDGEYGDQRGGGGRDGGRRDDRGGGQRDQRGGGGYGGSRGGNGGGGGRRNEPPPDDFGGDDIPF